MIKIINEVGNCTQTENVAMSNAQTHIAANDHLALEAKVLLAYDADDSLLDRDPIAWDVEGERFLFRESDVANIECVQKISVTWIGNEVNPKELIGYKFATDSESGEIEASDFAGACKQLDAKVPQAAIEDGGFGWVEDEAGERYEIGECQ